MAADPVRESNIIRSSQHSTTSAFDMQSSSRVLMLARENKLLSERLEKTIIELENAKQTIIDEKRQADDRMKEVILIKDSELQQMKRYYELRIESMVENCSMHAELINAIDCLSNGHGSTLSLKTDSEFVSKKEGEEMKGLLKLIKARVDANMKDHIGKVNDKTTQTQDYFNYGTRGKQCPRVLQIIHKESLSPSKDTDPATDQPLQQDVVRNSQHENGEDMNVEIGSLREKCLYYKECMQKQIQEIHFLTTILADKEQEYSRKYFDMKHKIEWLEVQLKGKFNMEARLRKENKSLSAKIKKAQELLGKSEQKCIVLRKELLVASVLRKNVDADSSILQRMNDSQPDMFRGCIRSNSLDLKSSRRAQKKIIALHESKKKLVDREIERRSLPETNSDGQTMGLKQAGESALTVPKSLVQWLKRINHLHKSKKTIKKLNKRSLLF